MQTKTIISVIALATVVVVGGYFAFSGGNTGDSNSQNQNTANVMDAGKKIAFSEFIKGGGSYRCSVNQYVGDVETKGTVFMDGDMIRGEYNTEVQGLNIDTSLIVRDGYTYTWNSMMPTSGFKIKAASASGDTRGDTGAGMAGSYAFNAEQIGDYDCETWTADSAMFALPAGVTFQEL